MNDAAEAHDTTVADGAIGSTSFVSGSRLLGHRRIAVLTDGYSTPMYAKTAMSLLRYRAGDVVAVIEPAARGKTAGGVLGVGEGVPVVSGVNEISHLDAIYLGIAPAGGRLPESWRAHVLAGLDRGVDIVSGLHEFLVEDGEFVEAAARSKGSLIDVRRNSWKQTARGVTPRDGCVRIHAVGHDCSVGKMVAMLEVQRGLAAEGHDAHFLATGQTGIMVSGDGVPIDCVVADFVNGAAESLVLAHQQHDYLLIEGQGSVSHPAFSAVTAGLLHGCVPDGLVFCYEAGREQVKGLSHLSIPPLAQQWAAYEALANLRHPCRVIGLAINTRQLNDEQAEEEIERAEREYGVPACDVYRQSARRLVEACVALRREKLMRLGVGRG